MIFRNAAMVIAFSLISSFSWAKSAVNNDWILKVSWTNPGADTYQECTINKKGKVTSTNIDGSIKRPVVKDFNAPSVLSDVSDVVKNADIKTNKSSDDNKAKFAEGRTVKDYSAKSDTGTALLRHEELESSSQNINPKAAGLISMIEGACGTATHK